MFTSLPPVLLVVQGALGAFDTMLNHEWIERLAHRPQARTEIGIHSIREAIYGNLFAGLAWFEWHGAFAIWIAALLFGEVGITAWDEFIENKTRMLPQNERVLHVFLTINLGLIIAVLVPRLLEWISLSNGLKAVSYGALSWVLSAFALASIGWSARDFFAWRRLRGAAG
jgi:putative Mn2+ efflux pump MntP